MNEYIANQKRFRRNLMIIAGLWSLAFVMIFLAGIRLLVASLQ